ncbi:MAG: dihydropteroate synthase [Candidatus Omnitrophica bacterium]|nr:dihydropteroate synthase [Candidatus Omnitrophota bacterium]
MRLRFLNSGDPAAAGNEMSRMGVDAYGIGIMLPKASCILLKADDLSCICANILKQEMLSCGGDAAVPRHAISGGRRKTECLLIGSLAQFNRLREKLKLQPLGLSSLSDGITAALENYFRNEYRLKLGKYTLYPGRRKYVMGILNLTPDSLSGDGIYSGGIDYMAAAERAEQMAAEGADIIDVGGESTRPGSRAVSLREELRRTIPAVKRICGRLKIPVSIDTRKPEVAARALESGAVLINDIGGLRDAKMMRLAVSSGAGVVIMHMKGRSPAVMQRSASYGNAAKEVFACLSLALEKALENGVRRDGILIDPGIGFGKLPEHNIELLKELRGLRAIGRPLLVGVSRKAFLGKILKGAAPRERDNAGLAAAVMAAERGADVLRVHNVKAVKEALKVMEAIR